MLYLMKGVGILVVAIGGIYFAYPGVIKKLFSWFSQGKRAYAIGVFRILIALVLLLAASQCRQPAAAVALGIFILLGGILVFAIGTEKLMNLFQWWQGQSDLTLRLIALVTMAFGMLIFYIA
jgi:uncharacterized membrane protein YidH (DUF202 family)